MTKTISPFAKTFQIAIPAAALLFCATSANAQDQSPLSTGQQQGPPTDSVFDGDYLTVGIGAVVGSSYEGSDNYTISPLPVILGSFAGVDFQPRGPGVALDVIPDQDR
ncbi:MAG: MipA/OmpV family protein, partial [Pseudomonadota bacterium]